MARRNKSDHRPRPVGAPAEKESGSEPLTATQQLIVRTLKDMEDRLLQRRDPEFLRRMRREHVAEELADVLLLAEIICCWDSGASPSHPNDTCLIQAIREIAIPAEGERYA